MKTMSLLLILGCIALSIACTNTEIASTGQGASSTTDSLLSEAVNEVASGTAILLDVREQSEWDEESFEKAVLVPMSKITGDDSSLADLDKTKKIYTHCAKGVRAKKVADSLREKGYDSIALEYSFDELDNAGFERSEK